MLKPFKLRFTTSVILLAFAITGCDSSPEDNAHTQLENVLTEIGDFKLYDRKDHPLGRFEDSLEKKQADFSSAMLEKLNSISETGLSETELISLELMKFRLQDQIDHYTYKMYLNPVMADQGFHLDLNYRISPILNKKDAIGYLNVLNDIPHFTDQKIAWIEKGIEEGISQPKIIFNGYESSYDVHIVENPEDSYFYAPFKNLPQDLDQEFKDSVLLAGKNAIENSVTPSFKKIKTFFEETYIPNTRESLGVSETPNGSEFYQNRINYYTTTTAYTADKIHEIGLEEVARIRAEMQDIISDLNFKGDFKDFLKFLRTDSQFYATTGEDLLKEARNIAKKIDAKLPEYFNTLPRKPYGVKKVADALAPKYTAGRYSGSYSPTQPGYYLVNTYKLESRPLYALPALTAHEAVPGHHLQGSLNQELGDSIPGFRRHMYLSAYGEGWGLYSEFLADEMGIYTTPYEKFGKLTYEMWRACRLVVDTGIHAKGWTRQQVIDYMSENTALSIHEITTETDRYISWPGQAISYKMGELKIREMRELAKKELGEAFDIREFHQVILEQGTVTLPILERRIKQYITHKKEKEADNLS